jgi:hypothetical protein
MGGNSLISSGFPLLQRYVDELGSVAGARFNPTFFG